MLNHAAQSIELLFIDRFFHFVSRATKLARKLLLGTSDATRQV